MKHTLLSLFLFILFSSSVDAQKKVSFSITEQDCIAFINDIQKGSSSILLSQQPETERFFKMMDRVLMDSIFTDGERDFLKQQVGTWPHFEWKDKQIQNARIINAKEVNKLFKNNEDHWDEFKAKYGKGVTGFSVPLFTPDKSKCVIFRSYSCGQLCGVGGSFIYHKVNGKWELVSVIPDTI